MIYMGTSGFSYDDWRGHFYPDGLAKKDMLGYYAARFPAVEIDSTYYTIPSPSTFASMAGRTPPGFHFAVKAHQEMTHAEIPNPSVFRAFLHAVGPLLESNKLGCVLAQFPWSFKNNLENIDRVRQFRDHMGGLPTVVEFRNSEWVTDDGFALLRELNLGFCAVDEPALEGLMPRVAAATSSIGYVRFHGRNASKWWKHEQPHERYDYLYSEEELSEWTPKVRDVESKTDHTYVFFNNYYQSKSTRNAMMFAKMLNLKLPLDSVPPMARQLTLGGELG